MIEIQIRLPEDTYQYVDRLSAISGIDPSAVINVLLAQYFFRNSHAAEEAGQEESSLESLDSQEGQASGTEQV